MNAPSISISISMKHGQYPSISNPAPSQRFSILVVVHIYILLRPMVRVKCSYYAFIVVKIAIYSFLKYYSSHFYKLCKSSSEYPYPLSISISINTIKSDPYPAFIHDHMDIHMDIRSVKTSSTNFGSYEYSYLAKNCPKITP